MNLLLGKLSVLASALSSDVRQIPRISRTAGFHGLLFDVWSSALNIADLTQSGRREFRQLLAAEAQELVGLQMDLGASGLSKAADLDRQIARIDQAMQAAAALETPLLCIDLGALPRPRIVQKPKPAISPEEAGLIIIPSMSDSPPPQPQENSPPPDSAHVSLLNSALVEIGNRADRNGVNLALSSSLSSFASLQQTIDAARCPWFGIDLDTVAILRDEWSRDEIFSTLGGLIRHARARDAVVGSDKRTKPAVIGRGNVAWNELLDALDQADYQGFLTIDPTELANRNAAAIAAAKYLQELQTPGPRGRG